jgi:hypothetical protein
MVVGAPSKKVLEGRFSKAVKEKRIALMGNIKIGIIVKFHHLIMSSVLQVGMSGWGRFLKLCRRSGWHL